MIPCTARHYVLWSGCCPAFQYHVGGLWYDPGQPTKNEPTSYKVGSLVWRKGAWKHTRTEFSFGPDICVFQETQHRNAGPLIIFHRYWPSSMDIESRSIWVTNFGMLSTSPFKHGQNHLVAMFVLRILVIAFPNIAIFMWRLTANSASEF